MSKRPKAVHQMTIPEFEAMFPDDEACCAYLVARRWRAKTSWIYFNNDYNAYARVVSPK
jgi:hypothetical protein